MKSPSVRAATGRAARAGRRSLAAVLLALTACIDITVDGSELGSLEFVTLPYPSINAGDTLRDTAGRVVPLVARVYRADGSLDGQAVPAFLSFDTLARITGQQLVAGTLAPTTVSSTARILATAGGLQSSVRTITVVPAPDSFARNDTTTLFQVRYSLPPSPSDTMASLAVRVSRTAATGTFGVPAYLVKFRVEKGGQPVAIGDTTGSFWLADESGRVTSVDTTDGSGLASRRLIFRLRSGRPARDTVEVLADVRRGTRIPAGPPIRWTVQVGPRTAP